MNSFHILRTQPALSSNVKIMVDKEYGLFLESIDSHPNLSISRLKRKRFNSEDHLDEILPIFYKNIPTDIAFSIKNSTPDKMSEDYIEQYDDLYLSGAKKLSGEYEEEFEYLAPLYVFRNKIPDGFIVFSVDGPGLEDSNRLNFRSNILDRLKVVQVFDMIESPLGDWINKNYKQNIFFPDKCLDVDFRDLQFSRWYGIDYELGGYTYKSMYLGDTFENESTLYDLEKYITDGYLLNKLIHPQILNFSFLFNDNTVNNWSLNRYMGFYIDSLINYDSIHPYKLADLHNDVIISSNNEIYSLLNSDPFVNGFKVGMLNYVEILGEFYLVEEYLVQLPIGARESIIDSRVKKQKEEVINEPYETRWRIISDIDLSGLQSHLNGRYCYIDDNNIIRNGYNDQPFIINGFNLADVNLIEIGGIYHHIIEVNGVYGLVTNWNFVFEENSKFSWSVGDIVNSIDLKKEPNTTFKIYRISFTDVKDFDTCIIDNDFARYEYEKADSITDTDEPKLYFTNLNSKQYPPVYDNIMLNSEIKHIPVSSDYTANMETFRIVDNNLTELWNRNPTHTRWGYQNSISCYDRPYLLNNSSIHGEWNRTVSSNELIPNRFKSNLDYFYSINSGTTSYLYHSLHVGNSDNNHYQFEMDKYLNRNDYFLNGTHSYDLDYFSLFFTQKQAFLNNEITINTNKYSFFERGDKTIPNTTVFRGLKFHLSNVDTVIKDNEIKEVGIMNTNFFEDYKFTVILTSNDWEVDDEGELYKPYNWDYYYSVDYNGVTASFVTGTSSSPPLVINSIIEIELPNGVQAYGIVNYVGIVLGGWGFIADVVANQPITETYTGKWRDKPQWVRVRSFEDNTQFNVDDLVIWNGIIYQCVQSVGLLDWNLPGQDPTNMPQFIENVYVGNPFWKPSTLYVNGDYVFREDEWYEYTGLGVGDFWRNDVNYVIGDMVLYQNKAWVSVNNSINKTPLVSKKTNLSTLLQYWLPIEFDVNDFSWKPIEIWNDNSLLSIGDLFIHDNILYQYDTNDWILLYSFSGPSFISGTFICIGDTYFYSKYAPINATLDSGITVYIHKAFKNVLLNISINDNTISSDRVSIDHTKNLDRDHLYIDANWRLTALNIIQSINNINLYGFSRSISYVIIEEDFSISRYTLDNIEELPYILTVEEADQIDYNDNTLSYKKVDIGKNIITPKKQLSNGIIDDLDKLNWYNNLPFGVVITPVKNTSFNEMNYNGIDDGGNQILRRHSGLYMPMFYDIELFDKYTFVIGQDKYGIEKKRMCSGNFFFDDTLSLFGIRRQTIFQKVNTKGNILKLTLNDSLKSIYPMIDEFGLGVSDTYIFKSNWDFKWHYNTIENIKNTNLITIFDKIINIYNA